MPDWKSLRDMFHPLRILWQNLSGFYCLGLDRFCPITLVTSVDYGREFAWIEERTGIQMLGVESLTRTRGRPSVQPADDIVPVLRPQIVDAVRRIGGDSWAFVCPLPCGTLPALALELGHRSECHQVGLGSWLNDKRNVFAGLETLGLPRLPGLWSRLSELRYRELCASVGAQVVAQKARGASGSGTAFIRSERGLQEAGQTLGDEIVWVAPEVRGPSINLNAVVLDRNVVAGCPNIQLVGLEMLQSRPGMYCGNDFTTAATLAPAVLTDVREQAVRFGGWLRTLGYRGLFGLDFMADSASGRSYIVDLNPRWQGSTAVSTQAEARAGRLPLAAAEVAWRLGVLDESEIVSLADQFFAPLKASQMSLRWATPNWSLVTGELTPGVYSSGPELEFRRPGIRLEDIDEPSEVLVTGAVPSPGYRVGPEAHLLRVYAEQSVVGLDSGAPLDWARQCVSALYKALRLQPVEG